MQRYLRVGRLSFLAYHAIVHFKDEDMIALVVMRCVCARGIVGECVYVRLRLLAGGIDS